MLKFIPLIVSFSRIGAAALCSLLLLVIQGVTAEVDAEQDSAAQPTSQLPGFSQLYNQECAVCHGEPLSGAAQGPALVGNNLLHGESIEELKKSIARGFPATGMPAWGEILSPSQINNLALYVAERRSGFSYTEYNIDIPLTVPTGVISSELHSFRLETVVSGLDPLPFSIAPLPDGRILVTEKMHGLRIVSVDGKLSELIQNTPKTYTDSPPPYLGVLFGLGWLLEVALHPDYANNGWVYLQFGDRCSDCNTLSRETEKPVSMNKLIRGRIKDGSWVDQQVVWEANIDNYGTMTDLAAGGRISFDNQGHLFFAVGTKGIDNHTGIQDLSRPWGKVHRINDDGSIPTDNPFVNTPGAVKSIWSYGVRSPQGLEFNHSTGQLWGTDMGPRGGDEVNLFLAGRNYGWPLYSKGANYDGSPVDYGKKLGIEFDLEDIEQPVVDLTPAPAVSSFIFYSGKAFPKWQQSLIVGSLKASTLYRMVFKDNQWLHTEELLVKLARIRDIETADNGEILVLLEHASGGQIIRLVPAE